MQKVVAILSLILLVCCAPLFAQSTLATRTIASGLDTPWEILWGPDDWIWVTERMGRISRVDPASGEVRVLHEISEAREVSESGLLGMAIHPDFPNPAHVFVAYTLQVDTDFRLRIERYTYDADTETLSDPFTLNEDIVANQNHDGCRLLFGPDNTLYATTGDALFTNLPQDPASLNGKTLRMNPDGSVPEDNPTPGSLVYSLGHRNAQGLDWGRNGLLYSSEHGRQTDDELNIIQPGRNYGWPNVEGFCDVITENQFCEDFNVAEPIAAWTPTLAPGGIAYYDHEAIPEFANSILATFLKGSDRVELIVIQLSEDGLSVASEQTLYEDEFGRLRDVCVSPAGQVFIATSNRDGRARSPFPLEEDDRIVEIYREITSVPEPLPAALVKDLQVQPNPASGPAAISFTTDKFARITFLIVDVLGRQMRELNYDAAQRGTHRLQWDGRDAAGNSCPPGSYRVLLKTSSGVLTTPFVITR